MSFAITPHLPLSLVVACKADRESLKQPGDYVFTRLDDKRTVILLCPICGKTCMADGHTIVTDSPLTLSPTLECPSGCRYRISQGKVFSA
ncbi:MAG: hypothetical protein JWO20_2956 [Candidatus Angelobacter sp.]|nr:hypothetical protein [Candidatus Angelobacter sp.]